MADESIEFAARYGDWAAAKSIDISEHTPREEIAACLAAIREEAAEKAFDVLGIDKSPLKAYAANLAKAGKKGDYASLATIYKSLGSAEQEIAKAAHGKEELKPFAKVYLLRETARQLGLAWYVSKDAVPRAAQAAAGKAPQGQCVMFMAKYGTWISIKKLSIDSNTKPEEVAAHLSSITNALDRKVPQVLGVDVDALDEYADASTSGMRKSVANLEKINGIMGMDKTVQQLDSSLQGSASRAVAATYLFHKMLGNIKLDLEVSPDTLMDMFPGLKIPKPRGNFGGKRKKPRA